MIEKLKPFLNHKYDDWTSEEVYDDLLEKMKGGGNPCKDGDLLDVHLDLTKGGSSDGDNVVEVPGMKKGMSGPEQQELADELKNAVMQAAMNADAGEVPGDVQRMIDKLTEPQMNWRELIQATIDSLLKSDFTWLRPNRKGWHMPAILPGMKRDTMIDIVLAIDTSGSISVSMLTDFFSEIAGIMEQFEEFRLRVWQFDTKVYNYAEFTSEGENDVTSYKIDGGGGTDFMVNWHFMEKQEIEPDQFIMFTDGMPCGEWGKEHYCDTLFLVNTAYGRPVAPFGQTVYYQEGES